MSSDLHCVAQRLGRASTFAACCVVMGILCTWTTSAVADESANQQATVSVGSGPLEVEQQVLQAQAERIAVMQRAAAATVAIFGLDGGGGGSGVIITPDGYTLTNYHVSSACGDHMRCGLQDGRVYDAVIVGVDAPGDVSLIKLLGREDFPTAPLADSDQVRVGQWCFAAGNPFVLATNLQPSISLGIVSGVNRYQYPAGTLLEYADCIQTDAAINPGNSGGPLFNMAGEVIGINGRCSFEKRGRVNVGVGYAISANQIKHFLEMLKSGRLVDHATLGATVATDDSGRVQVSNILSSSDAYRRGLRYGDEILAIADREVRTTNMFKNVLGILPKDWRVPLTIRRDGQTETLLVRLEGVHSEKQLSDLVNSENLAEKKPVPSEKPAPGPHDSEIPADDLPADDQRGDEPSEEKPASKNSSEANDAEETDTSPDEEPVEGQPNQALVKSMLAQRTGFANFYFNQQRQSAIWQELQQSANFSKFPATWMITGRIAGESTPVTIAMLGASAQLKVGSRTLSAELSDSMSDIVAQRRETGLLIALHALRQLLQQGPERLGDTVFLGAMPVFSGVSRVLAEQPRHDVLQTLWYDATVRFSCDRQNKHISLVEVFGDAGNDPVELYLDQYSPLLVVGGDGKQTQVPFPHRLRLQYGTEPALLITVESLSFSAPGEEVQPVPKPGIAEQSSLLPLVPSLLQLSEIVSLPSSVRYSAHLSAAHFVAKIYSQTEQDSNTTAAEKNNSANTSQAPPTVHGVTMAIEPKTVKLFGAGGVANLDAYQSGFFISDQGHVLTAWSTVLDVENVIAVTSDGSRLEANVVGIDPNLEIAVLATGHATNNYFDCTQSVDLPVGARVLAFSNLYGIATGSEMSSVQKGVVMARTELNARRGTIASVYQGPVLIIDAMTNNPGAAGGALTTFDGRLVGMLGKELRDASANTWLNYAVPMSQLKDSITQILSGKSIQRAAAAQRTVDRPATLAGLGLVLVPNVLPKTPAYVDLVEPNSQAAKAGLQSDDLILFINSIRIVSQASLLEELKNIDRSEKITVLVQRGSQLNEFVLSP